MARSMKYGRHKCGGIDDSGSSQMNDDLPQFENPEYSDEPESDDQNAPTTHDASLPQCMDAKPQSLEQ